jgi:hypothetical protein
VVKQTFKQWENNRTRRRKVCGALMRVAYTYMDLSHGKFSIDGLLVMSCLGRMIRSQLGLSEKKADDWHGLVGGKKGFVVGRK